MAVTIAALKHYGNLLVFKSQPSDLPHSVALFLMLLPVYFVCFLIQYLPSFIVLVAQHSAATQFFWLIPGTTPIFLLTCGLSLFLLYQILKYENKGNRFVQVASNYLGLVSLYILAKGMLDYLDDGVYYTLLLFIWFYLVLIHLFQLSFEKTKVEAFGLMLIIHIGPLVLIPFYIKLLIIVADRFMVGTLPSM